MRHINSWRDLEKYGIIGLTGEADGLSFRLLCDVTEEGAGLVERFLGGTVTVTRGSNWNSRSSAKGEHIGSVLLPYTLLKPLGAFILSVTGKGSVAITEEGATAADNERDESLIRESDEKGYVKVERWLVRSTAPGTGDRNQHAMSGRVD